MKLAVLLSLAFALQTSAFTHGPVPFTRAVTSRTLRAPVPNANLFETIGKIVDYNVKFASKAVGSMFTKKTARASHILFKGPTAAADAMKLKQRIADGGVSFADAAKQYSTCPSSAKGGDLGTFKPGMMVPQFDEVIFDPAVDVGSLAMATTQFGAHIIQITERDLGEDK